MTGAPAGEAIVCAVLPHGEAGAVVRLLTDGDGLLAAYVHGARGRVLRPLLRPGNRLAVQRTGRAGLMPRAGLEAVALHANRTTGATALVTLDWLCALTAAVVPEGPPHPALFATLDAIAAGAAAGLDDVALGAAAVRYELLLLAELGFGLDLQSCAATGGRDDLAYVSPRSAQAVSRAAGLPYATRLLPLPAFLIGDTPADADAVADGLALTGHFLDAALLRGRPVASARDRFVARFHRRTGNP